MSTERRNERHFAIFGKEGQDCIDRARVGIAGLGGLGSHVAQQLAYLGIRRFVLIDGDVIEESNLNRLVGATPSDVPAERPKVRIAERSIKWAQPDAHVDAVETYFSLESAPAGLADVDAVFGCFDDDPPRLLLTAYAATHKLPYIDLATEILPEGEYGGRMVFAKDGKRCVSCLGELDQHALARARMTPVEREADDKIYGIDRSQLDGSGPSVVSINGVVASLGVTEFAVWITGLREPAGFLNYRADRGTVGLRSDPARSTYCHYCDGLWTAI